MVEDNNLVALGKVVDEINTFVISMGDTMMDLSERKFSDDDTDRHIACLSRLLDEIAHVAIDIESLV